MSERYAKNVLSMLILFSYTPTLMMLVCDITTQEETTKWTKESNDQHKTDVTRALVPSLSC